MFSKTNWLIYLCGVTLLVSVGYNLYTWYVVRYAYADMPELSCLHLVASYTQKGNRILLEKKDDTSTKQFQELTTRMQNIEGEIYQLCRLDFTNEKTFTQYYPNNSTLFHYLSPKQ